MACSHSSNCGSYGCGDCECHRGQQECYPWCSSHNNTKPCGTYNCGQCGCYGQQACPCNGSHCDCYQYGTCAKNCYHNGNL